MNKYDLSRGENHFVGDFYDLPRLLRGVNLNVYPDNEYTLLRSKISRYIGGVDPSQILCTRGSHTALDIILRTFLTKDDEAVILDPTYEYYEYHVAHYTELIKKHSYSYLEGLNASALVKDFSKKTKVLIIDCPSNPFGNLLSEADLRTILNTNIYVIIDEEYIEFSEKKSFIELIHEYPNLIITRSFSKWAGLAGLRLSFIVAASKVVSQISTSNCSYSIDTISQKIGEHALDMSDSILSSLEELSKVFNYIQNELNVLGLKIHGKNTPYFLIEEPEFEHLHSFTYKTLNFNNTNFFRFTVPRFELATLLINEIKNELSS